MSRLQTIILSGLDYLWKKVLRVVLALCLVAGLTFLFTGGFSFLAFSERIFWAGLLVIMVGGTIALAMMFSPKAFNFPFNIRKPEDAKKYIDNIPAEREKNEQRLDAGIQLWLIGLTCIGISALVQAFLP